MNSLETGITKSGQDKQAKILHLRKPFWKPLNGIWTPVPVLMGLCFLSCPSLFTCVNRHWNFALCFLQAAELSLAICGPGQITAGFGFRCTVKAASIRKRSKGAVLLNCLKDVLRRGVKRLTSIQAASGALSLGVTPSSCAELPSGSRTTVFLCCALQTQRARLCFPYPLTPGNMRSYLSYTSFAESRQQ